MWVDRRKTAIQTKHWFFKSLSKSPKTNCEFSGCPILRKLSWVPLSNAHLLITGVWVSCGISGRERDKLKKRKDAGGAVVERADSEVLLPIPDGDTDEVKKPSVSDIGVQADIDAKKPPSVSEVGVQADIGACHLCYKMEEGYLNEIYMLRDWVARHYSWGLDVAKNVLYISKKKMMMHRGSWSHFGYWTHLSFQVMNCTSTRTR